MDTGGVLVILAVIGIFIGSILLLVVLGWINSKIWHKADDLKSMHSDHKNNR